MQSPSGVLFKNLFLKFHWKTPLREPLLKRTPLMAAFVITALDIQTLLKNVKQVPHHAKLVARCCLKPDNRSYSQMNSNKLLGY